MSLWVTVLSLFTVWGGQQAKDTPLCNIDPTPLAAIGNGPVEFGAVAGAAFINDSILVVADRLAKTIHLSSTHGRLMRSLGKAGGGPGEFRAIRRMWNVGDTAFVLDPDLGRISLITSNGFVESISIGNLARGTSIQLSLPDRRVVGATTTNARPRGRRGPELWLDSVRLQVQVGNREVTLGEYLVAARLINASKTFSVAPAPFSPSLAVVSAGSHIFVSDGSNVVQRFRHDGRRSGGVKVPWQSEPVNASSYNKWVDHHVHLWSKTDEATVRRFFEPVKQQRMAPAVGGMIGSSNWLWLQEYRAPFDERPIRVSALTADGRAMLTSHIPGRSRLLAATERNVAIVRQDEDDVETVEIYRIKCTK